MLFPMPQCNRQIQTLRCLVMVLARHLHVQDFFTFFCIPRDRLRIDQQVCPESEHAGVRDDAHTAACFLGTFPKGYEPSESFQQHTQLSGAPLP